MVIRQVSTLNMGTKFKRTPIGDLPVDWEVVRLNDLLDLQGGYPFQSNNFQDNGIPVVRISNVKPKGIYLDNCVYIQKELLENYKEYLLEDGDALIAMSGATTGKIGIVSKDVLPAVFNQRVGRFRIKNNARISKGYLNQIILTNNFKTQLLLNAAGGAQPNVSGNNIEKIEIALPSSHEQNKITEILMSVDNALEKSSDVIKKTKQLKKGLMQQLLTRGIGHNKFKNSSIGKIPIEWDVSILYDIAEIEMGQSPSSNDCNQEGVGIPFYQGNADFGELHPKARYWCDKPKKIAKQGDILISVRAPVGEINIAPHESCIGRGLSAIRPKNIDKDYLFYAIAFYKTMLINIAQGSTFESVNGKELKNLNLPIPKREEQSQIAEILDSIDKSIENEHAYKQVLEQLKSTLMQSLLTGKIRVTNNV